jgi:hypothetical protein
MVCRRVVESVDAASLKTQHQDMAWTTALGVFTMEIPLILHETTAVDVPPSHLSSLWTLTSDATNLAACHCPVFSPDGRMLAWLSMTRAGYESDMMNIVLCNMQSGVRTTIAKEVDLSFNELVFDDQDDDEDIATDGESDKGGVKKYHVYRIFSSAQYRASNRLFVLDIIEDKIEPTLLSIRMLKGDEGHYTLSEKIFHH